MKCYRIDGFTRIAKLNAKRRYENGETIYLCPHGLRPGAPWHPEVAITKVGRDEDVQYFAGSDDEFEKIVAEFTHYNCNYSSGKYPAYYIKG